MELQTWYIETVFDGTRIIMADVAQGPWGVVGDVVESTGESPIGGRVFLPYTSIAWIKEL